MIAIDLQPDSKKLRQFGVCGLVGFSLLGVMAWWVWSAPWLAVTLCILAALCLLARLTDPRALWPLYVVLTLLAFPLGFVISYLALLLLFYGIFTPIGLLFRLTGRDALHRRWRSEGDTYFAKSGPPRPPEDYYRQF